MAADGGAASPSHTLLETPTWAVATVCFVFILLGLFIEHLIHLLSHWLKKHRKTALFEAVEKLKSVLMLLGFLSLLLAILQRPISKICIPNSVGNSMLPCKSTKTTKTLEHLWTNSGNSSTPVFIVPSHGRRQLAGGPDSSDHCNSKGRSSLISQSGINQLNNFMFVLAIMQIVYCVITMGLGRLKMNRWKTWETETQTVEYLAANDPNRFRLTTQTTFGRRHIDDYATTTLLLWIKCFFRQFFYSVAKVDYLTLRHGFMMAHLSSNNTFNFQKYIERSLEDDFKVVVGISPLMWLLVVIFLLVDVHGWNVYLWVSFLPLIIVLVVGTKLEVIVAKMALRVKNQNTVIKGSPLNAFEVAFFVWVTLQFGIRSCYHENVEKIVIRVVLAVMIQILSSYITLPLYALVTQMGSHYRRALLEEPVMQIIKQWHSEVKKKRNKKNKNMQDIENSPRDYSSTTAAAISTSANSPETSHLNRSPTLSGAEFSAARAAAEADEITEE